MDKELFYNLKQMDWKHARQRRFHLISILYQAYLFNDRLSLDEIFEKHDLKPEDYQFIKLIATHEEFSIKVISKFLTNNYTWEKLLPLLKAILIFGMNEMFVNKPIIVISEMIEISHSVLHESQVKFVNAILDKIAKLRESRNADKTT